MAAAKSGHCSEIAKSAAIRFFCRQEMQNIRSHVITDETHELPRVVADVVSEAEIERFVLWWLRVYDQQQRFGRLTGRERRAAIPKADTGPLTP